MDESGVALVLIGPGSIDQVCPQILCMYNYYTL